MLKSIFIDHQRLSRKKCNIRNCNLKFVVNIDIQQMSIGIGKKYYRKGMSNLHKISHNFDNNGRSSQFSLLLFLA